MMTKYNLITEAITGYIMAQDLFDSNWRAANPDRYHPPEALYDELNEGIVAGFYPSEKFYMPGGVPTPRIDSYSNAAFDKPFVNGVYWVKTAPVETLHVTGLVAPFTAYVYKKEDQIKPISVTNINLTTYSFTPAEQTTYFISLKSVAATDVDFYVKGYVGNIP